LRSSFKRVAPEPQKGIAAETVTKLAALISINNVSGFGQTITVPDTYRLVDFYGKEKTHPL
jgi:hypothetical protein